MKATVDALVQVALYSAAITAGILLFRFIFKNRISSKLQYLMWWLLILRLLMPVTPDIGLHFNLQDTLLKQAHQAELPTPALVLDVAPASVPSTQSSYESVTGGTAGYRCSPITARKSHKKHRLVFYRIRSMAAWRDRFPRLADIRKAALLRIPSAPHGGWAQGGLRALRQVLQGARCKAASPLDSE